MHLSFAAAPRFSLRAVSSLRVHRPARPVRTVGMATNTEKLDMNTPDSKWSVAVPVGWCQLPEVLSLDA